MFLVDLLAGAVTRRWGGPAKRVGEEQHKERNTDGEEDYGGECASCSPAPSRHPHQPQAVRMKPGSGSEGGDDDTAQGPQNSWYQTKLPAPPRKTEKATQLALGFPSVSERSTPRTGNPISRRESPPYTPHAGSKQRPSAMYETSVGTIALSLRQLGTAQCEAELCREII